jgi:hypothetical protein
LDSSGKNQVQCGTLFNVVMNHWGPELQANSSRPHGLQVSHEELRPLQFPLCNSLSPNSITDAKRGNMITLMCTITGLGQGVHGDVLMRTIKSKAESLTCSLCTFCRTRCDNLTPEWPQHAAGVLGQANVWTCSNFRLHELQAK